MLILVEHNNITLGSEKSSQIELKKNSNQLTKFEASHYKMFRYTCIFINVFNAQIYKGQ